MRAAKTHELGRGVGEGSDVSGCAAAFCEELRQAVVAQFEVADTIDEEVGRLHVPVHDAALGGAKKGNTNERERERERKRGR